MHDRGYSRIGWFFTSPCALSPSTFWFHIVHCCRPLESIITWLYFQKLISEMKLLLDFIGESDSKFTFESHSNKGFSCLKEPLPFCLNPAKGNSRKEDVYDIYKAKGFIFFHNFYRHVRSQKKSFWDKITLPIMNNLRNNVEKNLNLAGLKSVSSKEAICKNEVKASCILEEF